MIEISKVSKVFDNQTYVVKDLSFHVSTGELLVILGASGSGKTTTLKMINRLIPLSSGTIKINNKDIATENPVLLRRSIGYISQNSGLFPHLTVAQNITLSLRLNKIPHAECQERALNSLAVVNLDPSTYSSRYPNELSGGEKQRVAVARALVMNTNLLLMDEPFASLDSINRHALQTTLLTIKKEFNKTILLVTHDILEAMQLGDRIAVMNAGRLEQIDSKYNIIHFPANGFVEGLFANVRQQLAQYKGLLNG